MSHDLKSLKHFILEQVAKKQLIKEQAQKYIEELALLDKNIPIHEDMAIIGLSCRFPKAASLTQFWSNLQGGVDAAGVFPKHRLDDVLRTSDVIWEQYKNVKTRPGCFLDRIDLFDHEFFGISPAEAKVMAPSQRLFLEVAWEAMENGGYTRKDLDGSSTGVYVGYSASSGYERLIPTDDPNVDIGNTPAVIASRLNYAFNLKGPSLLIDTTCSSSLAALHCACQAIKNKDCKQAIVGGVNTILLPIWEELAAMGNEASDGRCKSFDAAADGTNVAEGVGVLMIKPLNQAIADGNFIHAVIKGTAINSDAKSNGLTAPNPEAQTDVICKAWQNANIDPCQISYLEAHGTGTKLGDPIEIKALTDAFRRYTSNMKWCPLGSVKTNIGHLDAAAGMASIFKVVLSLQHQKIPPSLHFKQPNPFIDFKNSAVFVNAQLTDWPMGEKPRIAGISGFGISGTNAHVVVQEPPTLNPIVAKTSSTDLFCLSARSEDGLRKLVDKYLEALQSQPRQRIEDICYTVNAKREHSSYRLIFSTSSYDHLILSLKTASQNKSSSLPTNVHRTFVPAALNQQPIQISFGDTDQFVKAYMEGRAIDYAHYYQHRKNQIASLPNGVMESKRHWPALKVASIHEDKEIQPDSYLFDLKWVNEERKESKNKAPFHGTWLVFCPPTSLGNGLIESLEAVGCQTIALYPGETFAKIEEKENAFVVNPFSFDDYHKVFDLIGNNVLQQMTGIIHAWTCQKEDIGMLSLENITNSPFEGAYSAFYLIKLLRQYQVNQVLQFTVATSNAHMIPQLDSFIHPTRAVLVGLNKVITQELPKISTFCLDFGTDMEDSLIIQEILQELSQEVKSRDDLVAYRKGVRYLQYFHPLDIKPYQEHAIDIRDGDVIVFAGGAGYLGIQTCLSFARKKKNIKFVLLSRSKIPPKKEWDKFLHAPNPDMRLAYQIQGIREIEQLGSEVVCRTVDVTNKEDVKNILDETRQAYGHLDIIIVAMKHINVKTIEEMSMAEYKSAVLSKLRGTWLLDELTRQDSIRNFITFSSISSIMGGPVNSDCTSVNTFLDAFGDWRNLQNKNTTTLNLTEILTEDKKGTEHKITMLPPISYEEFLRCVDRVLSLRIPYSVIAAFDYKIMKVVLPRIKIRFASTLLEKILSSKEEESLKTTSDAIFSIEQIETKLIEIWKEVLGCDSLSSDADFFDCGGSSLSALKLLRLIEANLGAKFEVADLYTYSTVNQMKERICELKNLSPHLTKEDPLMDLLKNLENQEITLETAQELIKLR